MGHNAKDQLNEILERLQKELPIRFFPLQEIPKAVVWAEQGGIAIHENFHTRRRYSYHVISAHRERLERFCQLTNIPVDSIKASEFYRFWHLTWMPFPPPVKKKRPRGRPPKRAVI